MDTSSTLTTYRSSNGNLQSLARHRPPHNPPPRRTNPPTKPFRPPHAGIAEWRIVAQQSTPRGGPRQPVRFASYLCVPAALRVSLGVKRYVPACQGACRPLPLLPGQLPVSGRPLRYASATVRPAAACVVLACGLVRTAVALRLPLTVRTLALPPVRPLSHSQSARKKRLCRLVNLRSQPTNKHHGA